MEVVAPSNLAEGYQFPATFGSRSFMVTVPPGGVIGGQKFPVPFPREEDFINPTIHVPVGHWKDGLWDLFRYGYCHATVWNSCCCVPSKLFCPSLFVLLPCRHLLPAAAVACLLVELFKKCLFFRTCVLASLLTLLPPCALLPTPLPC